MRKQYHILNGDFLKEQFPENIRGEIFVARECLIDGCVDGKNLTEFYQTRAQFISENYRSFSSKDYYENTVSEFKKIQNIPQNSDINLWFEDDLFCQVNFWFVANLIKNTMRQGNMVFLIRPKIHNQYGFAGLKKTDLLSIYKYRSLIRNIDKIASLWKSYQNNNTEKLTSTANELRDSFPFVLRAVEAYIAKIPTKDNPGRPVLSLMKIMKELNTEEFAPIFREFTKRENIYGFGDLQVKRMLDELKNNR